MDADALVVYCASYVLIYDIMVLSHMFSLHSEEYQYELSSAPLRSDISFLLSCSGEASFELQYKQLVGMI